MKIDDNERGRQYAYGRLLTRHAERMGISEVGVDSLTKEHVVHSRTLHPAPPKQVDEELTREAQLSMPVVPWIHMAGFEVVNHARPATGALFLWLHERYPSSMPEGDVFPDDHTQEWIDLRIKIRKENGLDRLAAEETKRADKPRRRTQSHQS